MFDIAVTLVVLAFLVVVMGVVVRRQPQSMRAWYWFALLEYVVCGIFQLIYSRVIVGGGDTLFYARAGTQLSRFLEVRFGWAAQELFLMLIQRPSAFDATWEGVGANTGSMCALNGFLIFFFRSEYGVHFLMTGLALFSVLAIFKACSEASPETPPARLFIATVVFPSVAFWTSALHKESVCVIGIGMVMAAWRASERKHWFRCAVLVVVGTWLILLFRLPAAPPLLLGAVAFFLVRRFQRTRSEKALVLGPVYLGVAFGVLVVGALILGRISPKWGVDQIGDTFAMQANGWHVHKNGGSAIDGVTGGELDLSDRERQARGPMSLTAQIAGVPAALLNALFRPQLFDVHNFGTALSAIEMTIIALLLLRAIRIHGPKGILLRIQGSPFLLMCATTAVIGCAGVGLVTLNFGSLARYRVPFLPFYGVLVMALATRPAPAKLPPSPTAASLVPKRGRRRLDPGPAAASRVPR